MITDSFDLKTPAKRNPIIQKNRTKCDVCLVTFSYLIEEHVLKNFKCKQVGASENVTGIQPVYVFKHKGKTIGFYKTWLGASASVGVFEDILGVLDCDKFIFFGAAGCLRKEISHGKVMVPTYAYRDEGTSYHYTKPKDYIKIKNANVVAQFMKENDIPFVKGRVWTTDAIFRETQKNIDKRKSEGCIAVEMECSAMQAVCDFRNVELYYFIVGGDLLDSPKWVNRSEDLGVPENHSLSKFYIALKLAENI